MVEELLKKIPAERCWEITTKILTSLYVIRGEKIIAPSLGKGEGITSHIWGAERWTEINVKIFGDGAKLMFPWVKETFNIPVENAIDADDLETVVNTLLCGVGEWHYVEKSPQRVIYRNTKCPWMERYKEFEANLAFSPCPESCHAWGEEGHKAANPKIKFKRTTAMPQGDPYCEGIIEFKDD